MQAIEPLVEIIRRDVEKAGVISFARFMELALYCPVYGYYDKEKDTIGRRGDFFTSPSVGGLFGEMLALQFAEWIEEGGRRKAEGRIVEAGAHDGRLAKDILAWLRDHRAGLFEQIDYRIVEPSARRRQWQKETLRDFAPRVRWFTGFQSMTAQPQQAVVPSLVTRHPSPFSIIFSNELLDAMPVRRLGWDAANKTWFEWGVALKAEKFIWTRMIKACRASRVACHIPELPQELLNVLPDGFTTEICPAAENWWREAARILRRGKLLTIDYGLAAEEFFAPDRGEGTLRAYRRHHLSPDLLANAGGQDITAHVNFTALQQAGESAGLKTEALLTQTKFLTQIAERIWNGGADFGEWTPARTRQFQTLTHPEHLGRAFRVLVQSR